ncbi:MAG: conjugal transfer protein TraI [Flavobacteriales bacterium]|nr:conjugal transfer protein TraI [Flavobacteriales bacterium]
MKMLHLRKIRPLLLMFAFTTISIQSRAAVLPIAEIIRQGVTKIIVAVDLKIQRLQNETIWLQQAQQKIENILSESQLEEIATWGQRQKELYGDYYESLAKVKQVITQVQRVKSISQTQAEMLKAYQESWNMLRQDGRFTVAELELIQSRYGEIMRKSAFHLTELSSLLKSFSFQMSDGERLERIDVLDRHMSKNFGDLVSLNLQLETIHAQRKQLSKEGRVLEGLLK